MAKTRIYFGRDKDALIAASEYQKKHGGRRVMQEKNHFDAWWLEGVFWYSFEYTQSQIFADLHGKVTVDYGVQDVKSTTIKGRFNAA